MQSAKSPRVRDDRQIIERCNEALRAYWHFCETPIGRNDLFPGRFLAVRVARAALLDCYHQRAMFLADRLKRGYA